MKTEIKYRTFDELMDEVRADFFTFEMEGMIEPSQLIKVAQRVSYDLGLRIYTEKQKILEIIDGKVKLPDDFYVLTQVLVCSKYNVIEEMPSGVHSESVLLDEDSCCKRCGNAPLMCSCEDVYTVCDNTYVKVIHKKPTITREYTHFKRITVVPTKGVDPLCSRTVDKHQLYDAELKGGYLYFLGIDNGTVYVNYLGNLEDEDGNLLVLDHPMANEYYEYAIKQRILENLYFNGEDVTQKMQLIEQRLRPARNNALTIVNTPDFQEMYNLWKMNREAMYGKYYNMFKSYYL